MLFSGGDSGSPEGGEGSSFSDGDDRRPFFASGDGGSLFGGDGGRLGSVGGSSGDGESILGVPGSLSGGGEGGSFPDGGDGGSLLDGGDGESFPVGGDGESFHDGGDGDPFSDDGGGDPFSDGGDGSPFSDGGEGGSGGSESRGISGVNGSTSGTSGTPGPPASLLPNRKKSFNFCHKLPAFTLMFLRNSLNLGFLKSLRKPSTSPPAAGVRPPARAFFCHPPPSVSEAHFCVRVASLEMVVRAVSLKRWQVRFLWL